MISLTMQVLMPVRLHKSTLKGVLFSVPWGLRYCTVERTQPQVPGYGDQQRAPSWPLQTHHLAHQAVQLVGKCPSGCLDATRGDVKASSRNRKRDKV